MELRQLPHTVPIDILAIGNAIIGVFITLALILRLLIILFFVITALVQQRGI